MNKIISTSDRLFMSLMGPGGSGKTRLIFATLASSTHFYSKLRKTYFYKVYQPLFCKTDQRVRLILDFEMLEKLEDCSLVFQDSCKKSTGKEFVKIAVPERHKKIHCLFA